jgi:hypothetical protein
MRREIDEFMPDESEITLVLTLDGKREQERIKRMQETIKIVSAKAAPLSCAPPYSFQAPHLPLEPTLWSLPAVTV